MKYFQPYYLLAILVGIGIFWYNAQNRSQASIFYGFAENKDTEVNFNYPVIVQDIFVTEGQRVSKGDLLFHLQRIQPKQQLADEDFKISELRAESYAWKSGKQGDLQLLEAKYKIDKQDIEAKINKIQDEINYKKRLYSDLSTLKDASIDFISMEKELSSLENEKHLTDSLYFQERTNILREMEVGVNPFQVEINRLDAKKKFDADQQVQDIEIRAPFDGLVGNINCKEAEHIPSFRTLLNYYEPNPTLVKGFLHEDLIMKINLQDSLIIRAVKDPETYTVGVVTGMGSRIVEIPTRLRRIPDMKTYGREVLFTIPSDNPFIQKEKVVIEIL